MTFNVLTAEFLHETNTFSVRKTGIPAFEAGRFCVGNDGLIGLEAWPGVWNVPKPMAGT